MEGVALFQFRERVVLDPSGALANWNPNDHEPCKWSGIDCEDGRVVVLNLKEYDLEGILGPELGNLSHLKYLDLSKNRLSGSIPPELGQLTALEVLDLRDNNLSGKVPTELGGLHSLKHLLLCNNNFERSIPEEIEKLSLLNDLRYDDVRVSAEVGCVNRKIGHCLLQNMLKKSKKSDSSIPTKWSIARLKHWNDEGNEEEEVDEQGSSIRRILAEEEQYTNLIAFPPTAASLLTSNSIPTRSSGSFPAATFLSSAFAPSHKLNTPSLGATPTNSTTKADSFYPKLIFGISGVVFSFVVAATLLFLLRSRATRNLGPWKTGLSGQLRKAFVTGVPKLNRGELETACEDFSNIIYTRDGVAILYKGTLSSGVEIAVVSTAITSRKEWSNRAELAFRKKIDTLSRVNHKNFVNLIGYCKENEPFTRMMVFEYAPNGTVFEHLHVKELEHLDWNSRMRVIMGTAYCLNHMHELNPPVVHANLNSKEIYLTDDYAAKIADTGFWADLVTKSKMDETEESVVAGVADVDTNTYSFGMLVLEVISGSSSAGLKWLKEEKRMKELVDPNLKSFKEEELYALCEIITSCTQQDPRKRCSMQEVCVQLRQALDISPDAAMPRLSPLWWAELEILSAEAS